MSTTGNKNLPEPTFKEKLTVYLKGVKIEWGKITWPEKKQVAVETVIVLIVVMFFAILIYSYDKIFGFLSGLLT